MGAKMRGNKERDKDKRFSEAATPIEKAGGYDRGYAAKCTKTCKYARLGSRGASRRGADDLYDRQLASDGVSRRIEMDDKWVNSDREEEEGGASEREIMAK